MTAAARAQTRKAWGRRGFPWVTRGFGKHRHALKGNHRGWFIGVTPSFPAEIQQASPTQQNTTTESHPKNKQTNAPKRIGMPDCTPDRRCIMCGNDGLLSFSLEGAHFWYVLVGVCRERPDSKPKPGENILPSGSDPQKNDKYVQ